MKDDMFEYDCDDVSRNHFSFSFVNPEDDRRITVDRSFEYDVTWPSVLQEFVDFLSGVYGYDISRKIKVQQYPFNIDMSVSGWHGDTFVEEDK